MSAQKKVWQKRLLRHIAHLRTKTIGLEARPGYNNALDRVEAWAKKAVVVLLAVLLTACTVTRPPVVVPPPPVVDPPPIVQPDDRFLTGNFLSQPGCDFQLRYPYYNDEQRAECRRGTKDRGFNSVHYLAIEKDAASDINLYADHDRVRALAAEIHADGLKNYLWFLPETPSVVNMYTPDVWREKFAELVLGVDDVVDGYVMGLETTEYWTEADLEAAVARIRSHTSKPIMVHGVQGYVYQDAVYRAGVTHHLHQYWHGDFNGGFLTSTEGLIAETSTHAGRLAALGVNFVAFEYALYQPDNLTEPLGRAALEYGSLGFGNGGPREPSAHYRPPDATGPVDAINPNEVVWGDWNIANWRPASRIIELTLARNGDAVEIHFPHTRAGQWPVVAPFEEWEVEANIWVCGRPTQAEWHCATFDWLRPGSVDRAVGMPQGFVGSIKAGALQGWQVQSGEEVAFLVSTVARFAVMGPVQERSNIVRAIWP